MASTATLNGKIRNERGRGTSRRLRNEGLIPAVLYGQKENLSLTISPKELEKVIREKGENALIDLAIEGDKSRKVVVKETQSHPLRPLWEHVDFFEIDMNKKIKVHVPVHLVGHSPANVVTGRDTEA